MRVLRVLILDSSYYVFIKGVWIFDLVLFTIVNFLITLLSRLAHLKYKYNLCIFTSLLQILFIYFDISPSILRYHTFSANFK